MIQSIKEKIWDYLKDRDVSLVLLYDSAGNILWHRGRDIAGTSVHEGDGFCKTYILESFDHRETLIKKNGVVHSSSGQMSKSAIRLMVKSVYIQYLNNQFFLYIDSGTKTGFSEEEFHSIKLLGSLLGESIGHIREKEDDFGGISGISDSAEHLKQLVLKYAIEEIPVLLLGETGVGKSHIAGLVHYYSGRKGKFVTANLPTLQENLFESELFGAKKGAFTGADKDKKGLIDTARQGTLFLDEISEIPISTQSKLLRFIESKKYFRVGDPTEYEADVRIVAATNKDLKAEIIAGRFREDLYFRLNVLEMEVPPLRDRKDDIQNIVEENRKHLKGKRVDPDFYEALKRYDWPGNIRELLTVLIRLGVMGGDPLTAREVEKVLKLQGSDPSGTQPSANPATGILPSVKNLKAQLASGADFWTVVKDPFLNRDLNRSEVIQLINTFLKKRKGSYKEILQDLNLAPSEYKKLIRFLYNNKLQPEEFQ